MSETRVARRRKQPHMRGWPLWKVVGTAFFVYGLVACLLIGAILLPPELPSRTLLIVATLTTIPIGAFLAMWSWRCYTYYSRLAGTFVIGSCIMLVSVRSWVAILSGYLFWLVTGLTSLAFIIAWVLPALSYSASDAIRRELIAPRTRPGRGLLKWTLIIGLGGGGALGAGLGMSLARSGALGLAHLVIGISSSAVAIFFSQSTSHQLWPDRPWGHQPDARQASQHP